MQGLVIRERDPATGHPEIREPTSLCEVETRHPSVLVRVGPDREPNGSVSNATILALHPPEAMLQMSFCSDSRPYRLLRLKPAGKPWSYRKGQVEA
jgi:hypothetical protein